MLDACRPVVRRRPVACSPAATRQSHPSLAVASPDTRRSHTTSGKSATASVRRVSSEAPARSRGAERAYRGRPDYGYLAAASPRFHRIPLAVKHLRSRRSSAPGVCQIVAGVGISIPGLDRVRPPWCMEVLRQFSQAIQRALGAGATLAQHVRVDHRRRDIVMAQQFLNRADVRAPLEEGCGKRVT